TVSVAGDGTRMVADDVLVEDVAVERIENRDRIVIGIDDPEAAPSRAVLPDGESRALCREWTGEGAGDKEIERAGHLIAALVANLHQNALAPRLVVVVIGGGTFTPE